MKLFIYLFFFFFSFSLFVHAKRPNFVFILTDDQRYDAMGFMKKVPFLKTPNIDRISREGVHFKNAFTTLAMCGPSRASILTGTYPHNNGVTTNYEGREFNHEKTPSFPFILQQNGYMSAFIGKWHLAHHSKPRAGFNHWISFEGQGRYEGNKLNINGKEIYNGGYITDELNKYALEFINKNSKKPFVLFLSHKAVHAPFKPANRHKNLYKDRIVPFVESFDDRLEGKPAWQRIKLREDELFRLRYNVQRVPLDSIPLQEYDNKIGGSRNTKDYMRAISAVDEGIGKIYEKLEELNILNNTCIIFASDNGYMLGEHHRGDKRVAYNESMRIPWVMRMPGVIANNSKRDELVLNIDFAPTILDMAGIKTKANMDGKSVLPLLKGTQSEPWRDSFLFSYWKDLTPGIPSILAVRTNRYMYATYPEINDIDELYDLKLDPYEMNNLESDSYYGHVKKDLQNKLNKLIKETGYRKNVARPQTEPKWGVEKKLICNFKVIDNSLSSAKDYSKIKNHPVVKNVSIVKGLSGKALRFTENTVVNFPWHKEVTPDKGSYVVELLVKPRGNGVIFAQGNEERGIMLYVDNGRPGFVMKERKNRFQFIDSNTFHIGKWVHIVIQWKNFYNTIKMWVNGKMISQEQAWWPIRDMNANLGGVTLGRDPSGLIDPQEISPHHFKGDLEYFRIYRQNDLKDILNRGKAVNSKIYKFTVFDFLPNGYSADKMIKDPENYIDSSNRKGTVLAGNKGPVIFYRKTPFDTKVFRTAVIRMRCSRHKGTVTNPARVVLRSENWKGEGDIKFYPIFDDTMREYTVDISQSIALSNWTNNGRIGLFLPRDENNDIKFEIESFYLVSSRLEAKQSKIDVERAVSMDNDETRDVTQNAMTFSESTESSSGGGGCLLKRK